MRFMALLLVAALTFLLALDVCSGSSPPTASEYVDSRRFLSDTLEVANESIFFKSGSSGRWLLQDGFHHPDEQGALMSQDVASIRFTTGDLEPVSAALLLAAYPIDGSPSVKISISTSIDHLELEAAGVELLTVALDGNNAQELTLNCRVGESPFALDIGPDLRRQCLRLIELSVSLEGQ